MCLITVDEITSEVQIDFGDLLPILQMVALGEPIKMTCYSYTPPTWKFTAYKGLNLRKDWQVKLNTAYINKKKKRVFIEKAGYDHQGIYKCWGTYRNKTKFQSQAEVFVGSMSTKKKIYIYTINIQAVFL